MVFPFANDNVLLMFDGVIDVFLKNSGSIVYQASFALLNPISRLSFNEAFSKILKTEFHPKKFH